MLILAKTVLGIMLGFITSLITGIILIPILRKNKIGQKTSKLINLRHIKKDGTPTLGGIIFIIPTILSIILLCLKNSINLNSNLIILIFVFLSYGILGFIDDYLKIKYQNNKGLSMKIKFTIQVIIAIIFYVIYKYNGGLTDLTISLFGFKLQLGYFFGLFILFLLVGTTNAVNITDGLDGLCGGLSVMAFLSYGVIAWGSYWISGYQEIAIFCFVLVGAILISLAIIGGVFVIETLSSLIQIIAIRKFHKKVFKKAPLHHHFEQLDWSESDIVKMFWIAGFMLGMLGIIYGVWL